MLSFSKWFFSNILKKLRYLTAVISLAQVLYAWKVTGCVVYVIAMFEIKILH